MTKLRKLVSNTCWQENVVIFTSDHFYAGFDLENLFLKYISMVTYNFCCWKVTDILAKWSTSSTAWKGLTWAYLYVRSIRSYLHVRNYMKLKIKWKEYIPKLI